VRCQGDALGDPRGFTLNPRTSLGLPWKPSYVLGAYIPVSGERQTSTLVSCGVANSRPLRPAELAAAKRGRPSRPLPRRRRQRLYLYASGARRPRGAEQLEASKGARLYASGARRPRGTEQLEDAQGARLYASGARRPKGRRAGRGCTGRAALCEQCVASKGRRAA